MLIKYFFSPGTTAKKEKPKSPAVVKKGNQHFGDILKCETSSRTKKKPSDQALKRTMTTEKLHGHFGYIMFLENKRKQTP